MRRATIAMLLLTMYSTYGIGQDVPQDQCQRTNNKSAKAIRKGFPFDKASFIKVVSFKTSDNGAVEWSIPQVNGQVDYTKLFEIKTLNRKQTKQLLDILINVTFVPLKTSVGQGDSIVGREMRINSCYLPRHAILFEDDTGRVYGYVELCIECLRYRTYPDNLAVGDFCYEKYTMLEDFFRDIGIFYGVGQNGMRWLDD